MMARILSNLPEAYKNIVENMEDEIRQVIGKVRSDEHTNRNENLKRIRKGALREDPVQGHMNDLQEIWTQGKILPA